MTKFHTTRRAALVGIAATVLARPAIAAPEPIVDAMGRTVVLKDGPARRVVLGFNYEEFTAACGAASWDRVVGFSRHYWADWRPVIYDRYCAAVPRIREVADIGGTDNGTFSMERLLALQPDLVILPIGAFASLSASLSQLEALGIPVLVIDYNAETLARHVASTRAMGQAMGTRDRAEAVIAVYSGAVEDLGRRVAAAGHPGGRSYVELGEGGAGVIGNTYTTTMWGRLLERIGARNIALGAVAAPYAPMSAEAVLAADPEFVFIAGSSWVGAPDAVRTGYDVDRAETQRTLAPYRDRPGWPLLAAIHAGELHAIEHGLARSLMDYTATQYVAKRLYPAQFADVDPVANLGAYHQRFLPVAFTGCWMTRENAA